MLIAVVIAPIGVLLIWSFVSEAIWWREHKGMVAIHEARMLAIATEDFKTKNGRYPETMQEYMSLGNPDASSNRYYVDSLMYTSERIGCPLTEVVLPRGSSQGGRTPLIVISGKSARVEIYPSERIGVSQWFYARSDARPGKRLIILPNEPWQAGGEDTSKLKHSDT